MIGRYVSTLSIGVTAIGDFYTLDDSRLWSIFASVVCGSQYKPFYVGRALSALSFAKSDAHYSVDNQHKCLYQYGIYHIFATTINIIMKDSIVTLTNLPITEVKMARILNFTYPFAAKRFNGKVVYFRSIDSDVKPGIFDDVDDYIFNAIQQLYGNLSRSEHIIIFKEDLERFKQVYDGGRQKVDLTLLFLPNFQVEDYPRLAGMDIKGYKLKLNVYISGIIDDNYISNGDYTTYYYPANLYNTNLYTKLDDVVSL